jgi:hypothetical protein
METQNGIKSWQWIVTVIVIVLIIIFGVYWFSTKNAQAPAPVTPAPSDTQTSDSSINNGIVITDQYPGDVVNISSVQLSKAGFVVIKKDAAGIPGAVIGATSFTAGIHPGQVKLTQAMLDGSIYYAALYSDVNGDGKYDAATDVAVKDLNGKAIMKPFRATTSVQEVKG